MWLRPSPDPASNAQTRESASRFAARVHLRRDPHPAAIPIAERFFVKRSNPSKDRTRCETQRTTSGQMGLF
ncbi:MAG: hypothetical protein B7Z55_05475 [Planctomycetales bacterium 12-60-4]|nr:MAG: hypothetical protein B7Z55_05475 [Planctomycetales bacterium 12-60-4]